MNAPVRRSQDWREDGNQSHARDLPRQSGNPAGIPCDDRTMKGKRFTRICVTTSDDSNRVGRSLVAELLSGRRVSAICPVDEMDVISR